MSKPRSNKVVYWTEKYHLYRERAEQLERENDEIQLRILTLKLENEVLHADFVNANGRCDMQMKEIARLREALKTALAIESIDEASLEELFVRLRAIIDADKKANT